MAPTPTSTKTNGTLIRTPQPKHRLQFTSRTPNPKFETLAQNTEHPVEVVGRVRSFPDRNDQNPQSILHVNPDSNSVRVRTDFGYRDFTLDGVSVSEDQDIDGFYKKFVESRINGVKMGDKCTIMMYGPTGSGKSHTMFGSAKQPGIVYRSLKGILGNGVDEEGGESSLLGTFVQVAVLEIYNEEIYDLLSSNGGGGAGFGIGWPKGGSASKVRLEVMGKKAKNATYISGTEAGKISKEIQKVEKRRIVKSTLLNDRSSRSHCMIILDVPTVGGRLMLVDMAGSENIEQAGQIGFEAKMQTAKINQGNTALKRVVESIANGDSHVPFRDSKLTMLLQDSFEDDKSKILMILCASPDPKEIHKTISTFEYGAKAKCIVRGPHTPIKDKICSEDSSVTLGSRIAAMDQFICKLQMENKLKEKERNEAHKELLKREEEIAALRTKLEKEGSFSEEEINLKVNERTKFLKKELEHKLDECQRMTNEFVEMERQRMEEKILKQQEEVEMLRRRLEEVEHELRTVSNKEDGSGFAKRLMGIYGSEDPGMVKSMDLDMGDQEPPFIRDVKHIDAPISTILTDENNGVFESKYGEKVCLSTVFEEEEENEDDSYMENDDEVEKEMVEDKRVCPSGGDTSSSSSRRMRIHNIFALCGNHRELSHHNTVTPTKHNDENKLETTFYQEKNSPVSSVKLTSEKKLIESDDTVSDMKENVNPVDNGHNDDENSGFQQAEVYVKWEAFEENPGKFISTFKLGKEATLSELRKLIEIHLGGDNQAFTFLVLEDPTGAPITKEKEATILVSRLPVCNTQLKGHLACLRACKEAHVKQQQQQHVPFTSLDNINPMVPLTPNLCLKQQKNDLGSNTPFITNRRHRLLSP